MNKFIKTVGPLLILALGITMIPSPGQGEETSVRPGINEKFLDKDLKVAQWLQRFEVESREIFLARKEVLEACQITEGMAVADVGAGTGLYTRLFSTAVGDKGWVYAVEINPRWLEHILARAKAEGQRNISAVLCPQDSVSLAPGSLDKVFVCDTYHHFEFPKSTLASIYSALKPGGELIVIDFERIEGVSSEWTMGHVRAGKEVFRSEIEAAGFTLGEEVEISELKENYFLRFKKKERKASPSQK